MKSGKKGKNQGLPLVSVIIPVYNGAKYIEKAILSALMQEIPLEIIVIDDCSTDDLAQMLQKSGYRQFIRYIRNHQNQGVATSRNTGVAAAGGEYIAYLDADDWWRRGKLKAQIALMKDKECVLSYTARELVSQDGKPLQKIIGVKETVDYRQLLYHNMIPCSSVVMKRQVALKFPMRRSDLHEDYLQWLSVLSRYEVAYGINQPFLCSRMTEGGKSRNKWKSIYMTYGVYREMGIGRLRSAWYLLWHLGNGIVKYGRKNGERKSRLVRKSNDKNAS